MFGGDFRTDPLPEGADIVSLVRVVHDHDDEAALAILRAAWQALPAGGTLLLAEPMAGTRGAGGVGAYFAFYLLAMGSGRPRRAEELTAHAAYGRLHAGAAAGNTAANAGACADCVKMSCHGLRKSELTDLNVNLG